MAYIGGSVAFGLNKDLSDKDYVGVYAARPLALHLDLYSSVPETLTASVDGGDDYVLHEALKFGRLLLKGNPGIIEALFYDGDGYRSEAWEALQRHREAFLSQKVVHHYLGFVNSQIKQFNANKGKSTKKLYHVIRLLGEVERICAGSAPAIRITGLERDRLMSIRAGNESADDILAEADTRIAAILAAEPWGLPARADEDVVMAWLLDIRRGKYDSAPA